MKLVRPGCKRDAQPLDTNSANVVSWFLLVWPSFLVLWPSFWGFMGHGFWLCGCCFGEWGQLVAWMYRTAGHLTGLGGPHSFPDENLDLIGPITVVRHVAFSLRRCGRTADTMICFSFSVRSQPRFFHTLSMLVLRVQTAETTRTTTSRREEFPRHGDEAPRQWKKPLAMPLHSGQRGELPPSRLYRWAKVCCSVFTRKTQSTLHGTGEESVHPKLGSAHVFVTSPTTKKPQPKHRAVNINSCHFEGRPFPPLPHRDNTARHGPHDKHRY